MPLLTQHIAEVEKMFDEKFVALHNPYLKHGNPNVPFLKIRKPEQIKSFLTSSLTQYSEKIRVEIEGLIVNSLEEVRNLNKDLPNTLQEQSYSESVGYTKAVADILALLTTKK